MPIVTPAVISALDVSFRMDFERGQANATPMWDRIATLVPSASRSNTYGWLGRFPQMREWVGDRVVKDMQAHSYALDNVSWESTVGVDRDQIEDDATGTFTPIFEQMGRESREKIDRDVFGLLKAGDTVTAYDGQNFFDTDHPVAANTDGTGAVTTVSNFDDGGGAPGPGWYLLATGGSLKPLIFQQRKAAEFVTKFDPTSSDTVFMSKTYLWGADMRHAVGVGFWQMAYLSRAALTPANLLAAYQTILGYTADGGAPLGIVPDLLVVPPALHGDMVKTVRVDRTDANASNPTFQLVDAVTVPWLA